MHASVVFVAQPRRVTEVSETDSAKSVPDLMLDHVLPHPAPDSSFSPPPPISASIRSHPSYSNASIPNGVFSFGGGVGVSAEFVNETGSDTSTPSHPLAVVPSVGGAEAHAEAVAEQNSGAPAPPHSTLNITSSSVDVVANLVGSNQSATPTQRDRDVLAVAHAAEVGVVAKLVSKQRSATPTSTSSSCAFLLLGSLPPSFSLPALLSFRRPWEDAHAWAVKQ